MDVTVPRFPGTDRSIVVGVDGTAGSLAALDLAAGEAHRRRLPPVDDLDTTIRDIRSATFQLRTPAAAGLRTELYELVQAATEPLGFRPTLHLAGPIDHAVPDPVRPDLLAVVQEGLSNVVRHARASHAAVTITIAGGQLAATIADNGIGPGGIQEHSGLRNLRQRAVAHGGDFTISAGQPSGSVLEWTVPLEIVDRNLASAGVGESLGGSRNQGNPQPSAS